VPVYANATGREYPAAATQAREVLASQIVRPVNFMEQIEAMYADGVRTFVEVGPGHVLSDLTQSILSGREVETIALDSSRGGRSGTFDLALALARVAALGHVVHLAKWENAPAPLDASAGKPALTVPLSGANFRSPTTPRPPVAARPAAFPGSVPAATPAPVQVPMPTRAEDIPAALRATQEGILALQRLQEQTAQLHKQFLEGQESARRTIQTLLELRSGSAVPLAFAAPVSVAPVAAAPAIERQAPAVQQPAVVPAPAPGRERY